MLVPDWLVTHVALPIRRALSSDPNRSAERTHARIERRARNPASHAPPRKLRRTARVARRESNGWPVYEITPQDEPAAVTVVFIHGGGFINEIYRWHWALVAELIREARARCVVPIYPLVPRGTARDVVPGLAKLTAGTIAAHGAGRVVLLGDSAGGGMVLAAAMALRDEASPQPAQLVLISPWLDVTMANPRQAELESKDKMQRRPGMAEAGRLYAGELPLDDPRVSPIHGDLRGLPPITLFTGGHDLLDVDSMALAERAQEAGAELQLHRFANGQHDFAFYPTPRGASARREIIGICRHVAGGPAVSA